MGIIGLVRDATGEQTYLDGLCPLMRLHVEAATAPVPASTAPAEPDPPRECAAPARERLTLPPLPPAGRAAELAALPVASPAPDDAALILVRLLGGRTRIADIARMTYSAVAPGPGAVPAAGRQQPAGTAAVVAPRRCGLAGGQPLRVSRS